MKVGYVLEQFPNFRDTFILNEMLELEAQGVELHVFSLKLPGRDPGHEELSELMADVTQIGPMAPDSIFEHLEGRWRSEDPEAQEEAAFFTNRIDDAQPWRNEALALSVALAAKAEKLGITHFHTHGCGLATATAAETSRMTGIPFSFALHAADLNHPDVTPEMLNDRMRDAAFTVAECNAQAARVVERCGRRAASWIRVIYKGVDLMRWTTKTEGARLSDLIAVGPLEKSKGFDDFLEACAILKERRHRFRAVVVGDGPEAKNLKDLRHRLELQDTVEFRGALTHDEVRKAIARSRTLVAPSVTTEEGHQDATPGVIIEAMALGVPAVGTTVGGIPEIIDDPSSGWLVEPRDHEALAKAMRSAMKLPAEATTRGENARRRAEALFDLETNIACLAKMFYRSSRRKVANQTRNEDFVRYMLK